MFIPPDKIELREAIDRLFRTGRPLDDSVLVAPAEALTDKKCRRLREALHVGDLSAVIIDEFGNEHQIGTEYWRTAKATETFLTGDAAWRYNRAGYVTIEPEPIFGRVALDQTDYVNWVSSLSLPGDIIWNECERFWSFGEIALRLTERHKYLLVEVVCSDLIDWFKRGQFTVEGKSCVRTAEDVHNREDPTLSWAQYLNFFSTKSKTRYREIDDGLEIPDTCARKFFRYYGLGTSFGRLVDKECAATDNRMPERVDHQAAERRRSGGPGRPSSMDLVKRELESRQASNELHKTIQDYGDALAVWFAATHPNEAPLKSKSIQNALRVQIRGALASVPLIQQDPKSRPK